MAYFKYNKEGQDKESFGSTEQFLRLDKDQLFAMDITKSSEYEIRLLPPWSKEGAFAKAAMIHYKVGREGTHVVCPNMVGKRICPFCDLAFELKGKKEYEVDYLAIKAAFRYFSNIIDIGDKDKGVQVWGYGPKNYFSIKKIQDKGDFGDLTDPESGHNIIINREVKGKSIQDSLYPSPKPTVLDDPEWLDNLVDLDGILPDVNVDLVKELFLSHPFKVYEPVGRHSSEIKRAPVKEEVQTPQVPKTEEEVTPPAEDDSDMEAKIAKMRAKLAERNKK